MADMTIDDLRIKYAAPKGKPMGRNRARALTKKQMRMLAMLKGADRVVLVCTADKSTVETLVARGLVRRQDGGYRAVTETCEVASRPT
jgi:hypothetical protein